MKNWVMVVSILLSMSLIAACAKKPENIAAAYTSPMAYQEYECDQIRAEMTRVQRRLSDASAAQQSARKRDSAGVALGLILFWPALFLLLGGDQEAEVARLKGEYEALESEAIKKGCGLPASDDSAGTTEG